MNERRLFLDYLAQISDSPLMLEIEKAEGVFLFDVYGKRYFDLISGISVSNMGHRHPKVIKAISDQLEKYLYIMVYGEYVQSPQVRFANLLAEQLPPTLNNTYLVNSGSEAVEGALKLAKRYTGRSEVVAFNNAYHGSSHGALSVMGNEEFKNSFRPLVPGTRFLEFGNFDDLDQISKHTACVIIEPIQGEAGIVLPGKNYLKAIRDKCTETETLLILDEIQTGFGRTGSLFAFEQFDIVPDIICFAKGIGGGMPIGAFVSSREIMSVFKTNPVLGHLTTFGGHPVSCAAAFASLHALLEEGWVDQVPEKEDLFRKLLVHKKIKNLRGKGLFFAMDMNDSEQVQDLIKKLLEKGIIVDWFLFKDDSIRIAPPLIITMKEIEEACQIILEALDQI
ncbi:MAG: aspartate aminotransferase family protein [Bacteroidota bacterium]|nr:aspartate aminotransferase family protein [Bacteroidota bacterium]